MAFAKVGSRLLYSVKATVQRLRVVCNWSNFLWAVGVVYLRWTKSLLLWSAESGATSVIVPTGYHCVGSATTTAFTLGRWEGDI